MIDNPVLKVGSFKVPESNVFLMTRFHDEDYHKEISNAITEAVRAFGLELVRADNRDITAESLWRKVQFCMEACHFGVAVFEDIDERYFNPNVSLELGYMRAIKRQLLILKEKRLQKLPTDLCGDLYKEFDIFKIRPTIFSQIADWLKENKARKNEKEKLIVFVSHGGQDRCAIAKAITNQVLVKNFNPLDFRVESRAAFNTSGSSAADFAIEIVREKLRYDWLSGHRPRRAGSAFLFEADVILATDAEVLSQLRGSFKTYPGTDEDRILVRDEIQEKSYLISEYCGERGDIEDPFQKSKEEYEKCFNELYRMISTATARFTEAVQRDPLPQSTVRKISFGDECIFGTEQFTKS